MIPDRAMNQNAASNTNSEPNERSANAKQDPLDLAMAKLKDTTLSARRDLKVSRHLFRDEPSYIVHDPVSFQSHRFSQKDYHLLASLQHSKTLEETFVDLSTRGLYPGDRRDFYKFVLDLQMRGLLDLPLNDGARLYSRYKQKKAEQSKVSLMKMLFIKIPLLNPNKFLDRTVRFARPLFTRWFFVIWALMMLASFGLLLTRFEEFYSQLANILATRNLVILFFVMTGLKFWHELGHAYACKISGGAVPDMGAFLMAGMPMAYVDVSASWSFASRNQRVLVGLGGMYFESIAACIAMFIWAFTGPGTVNSTAHFVVLMASFMTVLFNANPLMRYDGYYILSDMTGVPNLRQRSMQFSGGLVKWLALGTPMSIAVNSITEACLLLFYGVAAFLYQFWLMLVIAVMISQQFFVLGIAMAVGVVVSSIINPLKSMFTYLWFSPELADRRPRAIGVSAVMLGLALSAFVIIPVPGGVVTSGQLTYEKVQSVRVPFDSYISSIDVVAGQKVSMSDPILSVSSPDIVNRFQLAGATRNVAERKVITAFSASAAVQKQRQLESQVALSEYRIAEANFKKQQVDANFDGIVLQCPMTQDQGAYIKSGVELARVSNGVKIVRALVDSQQIASIRPNVGDSATVRIKANCGRSVSGTIDRIEPQGSSTIQMMGLSTSAGGDILTNDDGVSSVPYFMIDVRLDESFDIDMPEKTTAYVRFGRKFETLGSVAIRSVLNFANQLFSE
jgi:putative peptide zinc metalloprotease protein